MIDEDVVDVVLLLLSFPEFAKICGSPFYCLAVEIERKFFEDLPVRLKKFFGFGKLRLGQLLARIFD